MENFWLRKNFDDRILMNRKIGRENFIGAGTETTYLPNNQLCLTLKAAMWWYLIIRWRLRYLLLIISTTSWFRIWIGIEGILLVRAPAILCKWDRRNRERAIKYFIIQAISGGIILGGLIFRSYIWIGVGLVIKLGIWPAYYWQEEYFICYKALR